MGSSKLQEDPSAGWVMELNWILQHRQSCFPYPWCITVTYLVRADNKMRNWIAEFTEVGNVVLWNLSL